MSRGGIVSRALARLGNAISRRELVGKDSFGNSFYRKVEVDLSGSEVERRTMDSASRGGYTAYDPMTVAPQWRQWLSKTRRDPPTQAEMESELARLTQMRSKIAQLAADDQKRRMQAEAAGEQPEPADGPSLERFVGQLTGKQQDTQQSQAGRQRTSSDPKGSSKEYEPETWRPGG